MSKIDSIPIELKKKHVWTGLDWKVFKEETCPTAIKPTNLATAHALL